MSQRRRPTAPGVGRLAFWSTAITIALTAGIGNAGPGGGGGPSIRIQVPGTITLQPILPQDILLGSDVRSVGSTSVALDPASPVVDAAIGTTPGVSLGINPEVVRQALSLWRVRIPPSAPAIPAVAIDYQLTSPLGVPDALGLTTQPSTTVDVRVIDLGYRVIRRGQGQGQGNRRIEGDVEFRFQSASLSAAGAYTGELMITVSFL